MKYTTLFLSLLAGVVVSTCTLASASDLQSDRDLVTDFDKASTNIFIDLLVSKSGASDIWQRFAWGYVPGESSFSLWPVTETGQSVNPWSLPQDLILPTAYTVTVRDENYKVKSKRTFASGTPLYLMAVDLVDIHVRVGEDSIQITHAASDYHVRVEGKVSNFNNIDFYKPTKQQIDDYALALQGSGLRAFYIHQDRIGDHQYLINNQQKSLTTSPYVDLNVFVQYFPQAGSPFTEWRVTYDNDKFAYRIAMPVPNYSDRNLAWDPSSGHNVFIYDTNKSAGQYWMFKKSQSTDQYEIISAADVTKYLNVDSDQRNVSVADRRHDVDQLFSLEPLETSDK